jgi:hypothetical protein
MPQPTSNEYAPFYQTYINHTQSFFSVTEALHASHNQLKEFLLDFPEKDSLYSYAPGKWTIKEVVQHLIDTERIMSYRALCIARGETTSLPGFDENLYAAESGANYRRWEHLVEEFLYLRQSTLHLFRSLNSTQLQREGTANQNKITPNALGFIIAGHALHHLSVIKERYLLSQPQKNYA